MKYDNYGAPQYSPFSRRRSRGGPANASERTARYARVPSQGPATGRASTDRAAYAESGPRRKLTRRASVGVG